MNIAKIQPYEKNAKGRHQSDRVVELGYENSSDVKNEVL